MTINAEEILVNEEFLKQDVYNLTLGGKGSWFYVEKYPKEVLTEMRRLGAAAANKVGANIKGSRRHQELLETDKEYKANWIRKINENRVDPFLGKSLSDEHKENIRNARKGSIQGSENPNFGKIWMYNLELKKSYPFEQNKVPEMIELGWIKGRKFFNKA